MKNQATQAIHRSRRARRALKDFEQTLIKLEHILHRLKIPHACVAGELGCVTFYIQHHVITVTVEELFQGTYPKLSILHYQNQKGDLLNEKRLTLRSAQHLLTQIHDGGLFLVGNSAS